MSRISVQQVRKRYGNVEALHGINLEIPEGKMTVLLGPSGCGKSTLLRMIAGLEEISAGDIFIDGKRANDIPPKDRGCAMVFQSYALYPHLTVYKNLSFPLEMAGEGKAAIDTKVRDVARMLAVDALLDRYPKQLSGGQRQRVSMGRAIIRAPKVYLFDEPLSNLDAALRIKMRLEIARLQESLNATMLFVTHDQVEAMTLAHQIVVMRDGYVEQVATPLELYRRPGTLFVARFIGSPTMNIVDVKAMHDDGSRVRFGLPDGSHIDVVGSFERPPVHIGFRPEHLQPARPAADATTDVTFRFASGEYEVLGVEHLGDRSFCYLRSKLGEIVFSVPTEGEGVQGDIVLHLATDNLHFFDDAGIALQASPAVDK
ncbi:ABC transporter ATP-binding protein [Pseudochelatococcus sp. B33]